MPQNARTPGGRGWTNMVDLQPQCQFWSRCWFQKKIKCFSPPAKWGSLDLNNCNSSISSSSSSVGSSSSPPPSAGSMDLELTASARSSSKFRCDWGTHGPETYRELYHFTIFPNLKPSPTLAGLHKWDAPRLEFSNGFVENLTIKIYTVFLLKLYIYIYIKLSFSVSLSLSFSFFFFHFFSFFLSLPLSLFMYLYINK